MNTVKDKVILITGAGQGLGAEICRSLAKDGAILIPADIKQDSVNAIAEEIRGMGAKATPFAMDVCDSKGIEKVFKSIMDKYGRIDAVINNAGIDVTKPVEELEYSEWDKVIQVNLCGPFVVSKVAYPYMVKSKKGHIVNIVSTAAKRAWANASAYHASKWGLLGFSHALHVEARQHNVKVTALVAGGMKTPFILERFPEAESNLQDPKNVADTVKYVLCQPEETVIPELMVIPMRETSWP